MYIFIKNVVYMAEIGLIKKFYPVLKYCKKIKKSYDII